jgi:hypothetical protein
MTSYDSKRLVSTLNIFLTTGNLQAAFADTDVIFLEFLERNFFVCVFGRFAGLGFVGFAGHVFSCAIPFLPVVSRFSQTVQDFCRSHLDVALRFFTCPS